jgi:hypothetical protein
VRAAASRRHLHQRLGRGLGGRSRQDHRPGTVSSAKQHLACSFATRNLVLMCPRRLTAVDRGLLESLMPTYVRGLQCFLEHVCCAPARAAQAHMPLRIFVGQEAIVRARGAEMCVSHANAAPRAESGQIESGTVPNLDIRLKPRQGVTVHVFAPNRKLSANKITSMKQTI